MSGETESTVTEEPSEDGSLFELVDPREMGTLQRLGAPYSPPSASSSAAN